MKINTACGNIFRAVIKAPSKGAIYLIRAYQRHVSPLLGARCRFYPTCSQYAAEAIERFGILRGGFYSFYRILRCNPLCKGGYDPVPETGESLRHCRMRNKVRNM